MATIYNHTSIYSTDMAFSMTCLTKTDVHLQEKLSWQCIYSVCTGRPINETPFMSNIKKLHLHLDLEELL